MVWHPTKEAVRRLWGRRWVRRVSYALVAGAAVFNGVPWLATRPPVLRWGLRHLDALVREETGLPLSIGHLEFRAAPGSIILHDIRLGGDLLTIQRAELQADVWSLLGTTHRIHALRVEHPHLRLTEAGLAALRLKAHPPRKGPLPQFHLEFFSLTSGEISVPEPLRGVPALTFQFDVKATGLGPNHVRVDLAGAQLAVKGPTGWEKGRLDLNGEASERALKVQEAYLRLGESQLRLNGRLDRGAPGQPAQVDARLKGILDLTQGLGWGGVDSPPISGDLALEGSLKGPLNHPTWTLSAEGQGLNPTLAGLQPGTLIIKGGGGLDQARLEHLRWTSPQGDLELRGQWSLRGPILAQLEGRNVDLEPLGRTFRIQEFRGLRSTLKADLQGPGDGPLRLDRWKASLQASLAQDGRDAGGCEASLDHGRASLTRLNMDLATFKLEGTGAANLGSRGLTQMEGEGWTEVDASQVAQTLQAWNVVNLDMAGPTRAQAKVRWKPRTGLELDGRAEVKAPRWHGARADEVQGKVEIRGSDLWVKDIVLRKDEGRGSGNLWLTWAKVAPGQPQMDMCYTAFRLPVSEGLRAADLKDAEGKELPLSGTGSGWVRLWGPLGHLEMTGVAQVEHGEAYGIKIPAASSDFWMDLDTLHMKLNEIRVAESPDLLGRGDTPPDGALALQGRADMDFQRWTWWVDLGGRLDSQLLALPGPRIQAQLEARLLGPITSPFGALDLPEGRINLSRGRLFFGARSVEGLEGQASLEGGQLLARVGMEGLSRPLLDLQVRQKDADLRGDLSLALLPDSAHTGALARSLSEDFIEDLSLSARVQGHWAGGHELAWNGTLDRLGAQFGVFELHQSRPSALHGNALGAEIDIALEGGARNPLNPDAAQAAQVRLTGTLPFLKTEPMALQAAGSADLAHLKSILDRIMEVDEYSLLSELRVQGTSRFDILAHGTYPEPLLDGTVSLAKGKLDLRGYQGVEDLQAEVILKDRTASIPEDKPLRGTLAHGDLQVSGGLNWKLGGLENYALKASLANFQLRDVPDGMDLQGSLDATLDGTDEGGKLKGQLRADRLSYQTEVKLTDLILRSALNDSGGLSGLDLDDPLERIQLDLDMDLRTPWRFDTNLLKLEGNTEGPFQILGTLGHPVPKGKLVFRPGGRITNIFPAGDMVVDRGSLDFSEARRLDPIINLQGGVSSIPGYAVNLDIHGTLSKLAFVLSSTPSLRQDEIVAILSNPGNVANVGTASSSSGATQGAIASGLASAGSGLLTTLAFTPLQEQLRRTLGVDRVNVAVRTTSLGTTETEFTLGTSFNLLGQRSALVGTHKKSGELSITSGQVEWRLGSVILQLGFSKGGSAGINPSGEIRHTWSPK